MILPENLPKCNDSCGVAKKLCALCGSAVKVCAWLFQVQGRENRKALRAQPEQVGN